MKVKNNRLTKDGVVITTDTLGTVLAFQNVTDNDHNKLDDMLKDYFDMEPYAIYYDWKMVSVFIFDTDRDRYTEADWKDLKSDLRELLNKYKYLMIANGEKESGSQASIIQFHINKKNESFSIKKKFELLLEMNLDKDAFSSEESADETHDDAE